MVRPIVVAVHPTRDERGPLELAVMLSCITESPLELLGTYWFDSTPGRTAAQDFEAKFTDEVQRVLEDGSGNSRACNEVRVTAMAGSIVRLVHERAEAARAGLIVVGSTHGGPVGRITVGSTADRVLEGAPCPVAVAPRGFTDLDRPLEAVGVAFVDTREGRAAMRGAASLCRHTGARLTAFTALDNPSGQAVADTRDALHAALEREAADVEREARVLSGGVEELIRGSAEMDLLVTGSRGYGPLRATVVGGVSRILARRALCPLIVIPRALDRPLVDLFSAESTALLGR